MTNQIKNIKENHNPENTKKLDFFSDHNKNELKENEQLSLLDNVQFIYELSLAQLELQSLEVYFEMTNSLRNFKLIETQNDDDLLKKLAYFKSVKGNLTYYYQIIQKNRTRSVNQYLTHWIYPYKGKFHPQMIRALLNIIGLEQGDTVLDPYIGSGTTALEAQLLGINCIGIDVSPLCVIQSKVKTESIDVFSEILEWKDEIIKNIESSLFNMNGNTIDNTINLIPMKGLEIFIKWQNLYL